MTLEMHPSRWGDPAHAAPLPDTTRTLVDAFLGTRETGAVREAPLPPRRLDERLLATLRALLGADAVRTDDRARRLRTRGKSTLDLLRARGGDLVDAPDTVVRPSGHEEVAAVLAWAVENRVAVVPFGGGTSVTGGLVAARGAGVGRSAPRAEGYAGVVSLDLGRLDRLLSVDTVSMTATLGAGMRGPAAEALLGEHGLTLGHFPQSFEFASIGGFAATRSSGQSSAGFGRFDAMVVGLRVATPVGELRLGTAPASAAGPDLRQLVLGSEGAFGVVTEVTVRVRAREERDYEAWSFPTFADGADAVRRLVQADLAPSVLRLSDEAETLVNLASQDEVGGEPVDGCLLIVGYESDSARRKRAALGSLLGSTGGTALGSARGEAWARGRFHAPYLRDSMLDAGVLVETLETATFWSQRDAVYTAVRAALADALPGALVLCHVSHVYETGCSLYFTVAASQADDPVPQWLAAKAAACEAIADAGATITHHHGVGTDHKPWLEREIGSVGVSVLRAVKDALDPAGILNPGVLIP